MAYTVAVKVLATSLLLVAVYLAWWAVSYGAAIWWLGAAVSLAASFGLFTRKRWGQVLWYAIAITASSAWILAVLRVMLAGWPHSSFLSSLVSLLPGLLLLVVCVAGSVAVAKHFRAAENVL